MAGAHEPEQRIVQFTVPMNDANEALHIGRDDLPWLEVEEGLKSKVLHVDLNRGLWVIKALFSPGHSLQTHYHTGTVFAVTLSGCWYYKEYPTQVNRAGSYLFEPAHSIHTLTVPEDNTEDTEAWFAINGCNVSVDEGGNILGIVDAKSVLQTYREGCRQAGLDCRNTIVVGER